MRSTTQFLAIVAVAVAASVTIAQPVGFFTDVRPVLQDATFSDFTVAVTEDDLTIFFTNGGMRAGEGGEDIWMATRSDPELAFENIVNLGPNVNTPGNDGVGCVSRDGLTLYFGSSRTGDFDLFQATRTSMNLPFGNVTSLGPGVNTLNTVENSPSVTSDESLMVYHSRPDVTPQVERDIWMATRDPATGQFGNAGPLNAAINEYSETWPNISADGLLLLWSDWIEFAPRPGGQGSIDIWASYRQSVNDDFTTVMNLNDMFPGTSINGAFADAAPYVSSNWPAVGSKLYFVSNSLTGQLVADVFQATWVPEPAAVTMLLIGLVGITASRR